VTRDFLVLAKPAGARCNLRCRYCYYLDRQGLLPGAPERMQPALLERFIRERFEATPGPSTHFEWHGGEPTLLGLDFFREAVALQRKHRPPGRDVSNGLQTNGTLLDAEWVRFLAREGFSVGLSLDGPAPLHDPFRPGPAHARTEAAFRLLQRASVHVDVLCVVHAGNAARPGETYDYFRRLGATHLQFLPLAQGPCAAAPEAVGRFLCEVFDRWVRHDLGRIAVQFFDEALRPALRVPHALCIFRETCGDVLVAERDGSVFMCDHFVDLEHRLGRIGARTLAELAESPELLAFGRAKRDGLAAGCRSCDVLAWCNGGCPKDRTGRTAAGEPLNALCPAYRAFFRHARPVLGRLASHWKAGLPLASFAAVRPGDPCPCGSGKKFKRCCSR